MKQRVLITSDQIGNEELNRLLEHAEVFVAKRINEKELLDLLPTIDSIIVFNWPHYLTEQTLARMKKLRFIQSVWAGVNHIPFKDLSKDIVVCSNAGSYTPEVAEFTLALLLAAAKRITEYHISVIRSAHDRKPNISRENIVTVLNGKTLGVLGYGSIGREVSRLVRAIGMKVIAFSRKAGVDDDVSILSEKEGMLTVLRSSDAIVITLPLTRITDGIISKHELEVMKEKAIIVNTARAELLNQKDLYNHLRHHQSFMYATDVWWTKDGGIVPARVPLL